MRRNSNQFTPDNIRIAEGNLENERERGQIGQNNANEKIKKFGY